MDQKNNYHNVADKLISVYSLLFSNSVVTVIRNVKFCKRYCNGIVIYIGTMYILKLQTKI